MTVLAVASAGLLMAGGAADPIQASERFRHPPNESAADTVLGVAPSVQALAVTKGHVLYAGSFGLGIFRSDNRGDSWTPVNSGLADLFVHCLAVAEDGAVYAGTARGGVFRSHDGGRSWQTMNSGLKRLEVKALLIDRGALFAGTGDGVYRYNRTEGRWDVVTKGLDDILVNALAIGADRTLFAGTSGKGIMRHAAGAEGWTRMRSGLVDHEGLIENYVRVIALDKDQRVYIGTFDGGVFHSEDGGRSWRPMSRALPNDSIRGIVAVENGLVVATGRGIFKTEDHGRQWKPLNKGLTELSIQVLIPSGEGGFYAGTNNGVFRSQDNGQSWVAIVAGMDKPAEMTTPR
jgi:photosystem II stability/assembly factor-like uncharacterized protein